MAVPVRARHAHIAASAVRAQTAAFSSPMPMDAVKSIARSPALPGLTVNDVAMAALAGGIRRYVAEQGAQRARARRRDAPRNSSRTQGRTRTRSRASVSICPSTSPGTTTCSATPTAPFCSTSRCARRHGLRSAPLADAARRQVCEPDPIKRIKICKRNMDIIKASNEALLQVG